MPYNQYQRERQRNLLLSIIYILIFSVMINYGLNLLKEGNIN
jgi:hypothetical protein